MSSVPRNTGTRNCPPRHSELRRLLTPRPEAGLMALAYAGCYPVSVLRSPTGRSFGFQHKQRARFSRKSLHLLTPGNYGVP